MSLGNPLNPQHPVAPWSQLKSVPRQRAFSGAVSVRSAAQEIIGSQWFLRVRVVCDVCLHLRAPAQLTCEAAQRASNLKAVRAQPLLMCITFVHSGLIVCAFLGPGPL